MNDVMAEPAEIDLVQAEERVRGLINEISLVIERHVDKHRPEDEAVADIRCAVVIALGRVVEATGWEPFEVIQEVSEIMGVKMEVLTTGTKAAS